MTDETPNSALSRFFSAPDAIESYDDSAPAQLDGFLPTDRIMIPAQLSKTIMGQTYAGYGGLTKDDLEFLDEGARQALGITLDAKGKINSTAARGHVFVGNKDRETGEVTLWKFANLWFIPLANLVSWAKNDKGFNSLVGARTYWPHDDVTGARDLDQSKKPACRSNDGYNPVAFYVGRDTNREEIGAGFEPRYGKWIPFGYDANGNQLEVGKICQRCPFAEFKDVNGKLMAPSCKESFNFIVYLPGQFDLEGNWMSARLAVLSGNNVSITQALKGREPGAKMGHSDPTKALVSIMKYRESKKTEKFVALEDLTEDMLTSVTHFTATNSAADKGRNRGVAAVKKGSVTSYLDLDEVLNAISGQFEAKFAVVEIESFLWAPQGLPNLVPNAPVYKCSLSVVENNGAPAQRIPYIQTGAAMGTFFSEPMNEEEFFEFQQAATKAAEYRAKWAAQIPENQAAVAAKLADLRTPQVSVSDPTALLSDGIDEGSFSSIDD
jgi:hypothetical protein